MTTFLNLFSYNFHGDVAALVRECVRVCVCVVKSLALNETNSTTIRCSNQLKFRMPVHTMKDDFISVSFTSSLLRRSSMTSSSGLNQVHKFRCTRSKQTYTYENIHTYCANAFAWFRLFSFEIAMRSFLLVDP